MPKPKYTELKFQDNGSYPKHSLTGYFVISECRTVSAHREYKRPEMTNAQFQTFMQQLDASLAEIGHEISEDEPTGENLQLFMLALTRRVRQGFLEISKQLSLAEGARSATEAVREPQTPTDHYYQNQEWLRTW